MVEIITSPLWNLIGIILLISIIGIVNSSFIGFTYERYDAHKIEKATFRRGS